MTVRPSDVLDQAIENLNAWGWTRHNMLTPRGNMCLVGAVRAAAGVDQHKQDSIGWREDYTFEPSDAARRRYGAALDYVRRALNLPACQSVTWWNDRYDRLFAEVIVALTKARDLALKEGR